MRFIALTFTVVALLPTVSHAQWRLFGGRSQVGSACPGGVCPTSAAPQSNYRSVGVGAVLAAPVKAIDNRAGHWSYPGTIDSHLESTHGVATAGMTRQQKLDLHDSLHEGGAQARYPAVANSVGYGSSGVRVGGGSSGNFGVGTILPDGAVVTSVGVTVAKTGCGCGCPNCTCGGASEATEMRAVGAIGDRRSNRIKFRNELIEAAQQAKDAGSISQLELQLLTKKVHRNPFALQVLHEAVYDSAVADGMQSVGERDWIALIEKLIPLIIKLIDLFS